MLRSVLLSHFVMCIQLSGLECMQYNSTALLQYLALGFLQKHDMHADFAIHDPKLLNTMVRTPRLGSSHASLAFPLATLHVQS